MLHTSALSVKAWQMPKGTLIESIIVLVYDRDKWILSKLILKNGWGFLYIQMHIRGLCSTCRVVALYQFDSNINVNARWNVIHALKVSCVGVKLWASMPAAIKGRSNHSPARLACCRISARRSRPLRKLASDPRYGSVPFTDGNCVEGID